MSYAHFNTYPVTSSFWIDYTSDIVDGIVPVATRDNQNWYFDDGAYSVYDYYHRGYDGDDMHPAMVEWERVVREVVCPKLAECSHGHSVSININGLSWTFTRNDMLDDCGMPIDQF
jgi:hypothetical protein